MGFPKTAWLALLLWVAASALFGQDVLRGEVWVDLEPVYLLSPDIPYPPDTRTVHRRALEEAVMVYTALIYGWSFDYDIGERARGIEEAFELHPMGSIEFGDPALSATDAQVRGNRLHLWTDFRLNEAQQRRVAMWKAGTVQTVQATGYGPLGGPVEEGDWIALRRAALEDAARAAVRALLRGRERNRPKEARGYICLAGFPAYRFDGGRWAVSARFRVELRGVVPFGAY